MIEHIETNRSTNQQVAPGIFTKRLQFVSAYAMFILLIVFEVAERIAIVATKAFGSTDPDKTFAVLKQSIYSALGKSIGNTEMFETQVTALLMQYLCGKNQ